MTSSVTSFIAPINVIRVLVCHAWTRPPTYVDHGSEWEVTFSSNFTVIQRVNKLFLRDVYTSLVPASGVVFLQTNCESSRFGSDSCSIP